MRDTLADGAPLPDVPRNPRKSGDRPEAHAHARILPLNRNSPLFVFARQPEAE